MRKILALMLFVIVLIGACGITMAQPEDSCCMPVIEPACKEICIDIVDTPATNEPTNDQTVSDPPTTHLSTNDQPVCEDTSCKEPICEETSCSDETNCEEPVCSDDINV